MFTTIDQVWAAIDAGHTVCWCSDGYQVIVEPWYEYNIQDARRGNQTLSVRYTENWFGGILTAKELGSLYIK